MDTLFAEILKIAVETKILKKNVKLCTREKHPHNHTSQDWATNRKASELPKGKWRKIMATRFNKKPYGQRWQVETVNSMIKRKLSSALRARSYWSQCREMMLLLFLHNVLIV